MDSENTHMLITIVILLIILYIIHRFIKSKVDKYEVIRNNYELYPYGVDINHDVLDTNAQENNIQGYDMEDNDVIGFNNEINKYATFEKFESAPITTSNPTCDLDTVKINHINEVDVINSFIKSQLEKSKQIRDNDDYDINNVRNNNVGKYSDINTQINQNSMNHLSAPDIINSIRTSDGKEKFSSLGDTLWEAYDSLVKTHF
jgi:hypothetical protein